MTRHLLSLPLSLSLTLYLLLLSRCSLAAPSLPLLLHQSSPLCRGGYFRTVSGTCKPCPAGTYRLSSSSSNTCTSCPAGTFQPLTGVSRAYLCRSCYPGTFTGHTASHKCYTCPSGKTSGFQATRCTRCHPGSAVSLYGAECTRCTDGSYSSGINAKQCDLCINGVLNTARTKCTTCIPGMSCSTKCYDGSVLRNGTCEQCPQGSHSKQGDTQCTPCPKGTAKGKYDYACEPCSSAGAAPGTGSMACKNGLGKCPESYFQNAVGSCITCAAGERRSGKTCVACPVGKVSPGGSSMAACQSCPVNAFADEQGGDCTCKDGEHIVGNSCVKCAAGTFRNNEKHVARYGCEPCPPGWVSGKGQGTCNKCVYGSVANWKKTQCKVCNENEGKVPNVLGYIDLYYDYAQSKCIDGRSGRGQGPPPVPYPGQH